MQHYDRVPVADPLRVGKIAEQELAQMQAVEEREVYRATQNGPWIMCLEEAVARHLV